MTEYNDDALIAEFVTESRDHLMTIEPDLLSLERGEAQADTELINRIFRAIHSIKGASGFFGFEGLKRLSHVMESLLMKIRDGEATVTPGIIESLLLGVDKLNILLGDIQNSDQFSIDDEMARLSVLLQTSGSETASGHPVEQAPASTAAIQVVSCISRPVGGITHYAITLISKEDLTPVGKTIDVFLDLLGTFGEVTAVNPENTDSGECFQVHFSSVLEPDLVSHATSLPPSRIQVQAAGAKTLLQEAHETAAPVQALAMGSEAQTLPANKSPVRAGAHDASESIRVRIDLLNKLMELAGEMVLSRNQLLRLISQDTSANASGLNNIAQNIDLITSDLQEHIMQTRMQPIGSVFGKFPRIIRDMAKQLSKEINLVMEGEDVELDKSIIESLSDPLTHLIRNCCDHGIEMPGDREQLDKPRAGTVVLRAFHQDGQIHINIVDDGKGIDTSRLVQKALQKNLITEAEVSSMSGHDLTNLIFLPGLSTAEKISDISGRGVGMDVVKTNITRLGGQIHIDTTPGKGTSLTLRLPLTLAIIPSLIVGVAEQRFAIPQVNLVELVHVGTEDISHKIEKVGTATVLKLRDQLLPLLRLSEVLGIPQTVRLGAEISFPERRDEIADIREDNPKPNRRKAIASDYKIIVLRAGNNQFGLIVDTFFDTEEIVVKSLSCFLKNCHCFSGATIMGDGTVAMILDPNGIIVQTALSFEAIESEQSKRDALNKQLNKVKKAETLLLFNNHQSEHFAVSLAEIQRLEKCSLNDVTCIGNQEFIHYQNKGLPLLRLEHYLPIKPISEEQGEAYLIIPKEGHGRVGLIVSRLLDVYSDAVAWEEPLDSVPGKMGWAVIQKKLTVKLDLSAVLQQAGLENLMTKGSAA